MTTPLSAMSTAELAGDWHECRLHPVNRKRANAIESELRRRHERERRLVEACKLALRRLGRLGAEDQDELLGEPIGPCPACAALRAALAEYKETSDGK